MARVMGPFMSVDASGTIFNTLTASIWKGRNVIRGYALPANPNTDLQKTQRLAMAAAVAGWQGLDAVPAVPQVGGNELFKSYWNAFAATCQPPISGFNAYVKAYIAEAGAPDIPLAPYVGKKGIR